MAVYSRLMLLSQLLLPIAAGLLMSNSPAAAQLFQETKSVPFGTGCQERIKPMQAGLGSCLITGTRARIWCPNGKVFERDGEVPQISLIRSACGLKQIL
jgi:hypothetical protein